MHRLSFFFKILEFDNDPSEITALLEIEPTEYWLKGSWSNKNTYIHKENGWKIEKIFKISRRRILDKVFVDNLTILLKLIEPKKKIIKELSEKYYVELTIGLLIDENSSLSPPWIYFSKEHLELLAEIGCNIDFDIVLMK